MVSPDRRAFAYGLFTGIYGTAWVLGSIVIGVLVSVSLGGLVAFCSAPDNCYQPGTRTPVSKGVISVAPAAPFPSSHPRRAVHAGACPRTQPGPGRRGRPYAMEPRGQRPERSACRSMSLA